MSSELSRVTSTGNFLQQGNPKSQNLSKEKLSRDMQYKILSMLSPLSPEERREFALVGKKWYQYLKRLSQRDCIQKSINQAFRGEGRKEKFSPEKVKKVAMILLHAMKDGGKVDLIDYHFLLSTALKAMASQCVPRQNYIVDEMLKIWKSQKKHYKSLLENFSRHDLSPETRLFLLGREDLRPDLHETITSTKQENGKGIILQEVSSFFQKDVDDGLREYLRLGSKNTFQKGELVAIDDRGNLAHDRTCLFYAVVREIKQEAGKVQYIVSPNRFVLKGKVHWLDSKTLPSEAIGKIPDNYYTRELLPQEYKV